jgi:hypothetical protein
MTAETPREETDTESADTYRDQKEEQVELESLTEEKGDFQEAVDAQRRGEEPSDEKPSSQA